MTLPDVVNGLFEAGGGAMQWMNCLRLHRDRQVKGVYWPATVFFTAWGFYNLFFYPHLGQWASFAGGLVIVAGNATWVGMALKYRSKS